VVAAASALIRDPTLSDEAIVSLIPGPDLPTGGVTPSVSAARQIYLTGEGILPVRLKIEVVNVGSQLAAVVHEFPSWVRKSRLEAEVSEGIRAGTLRSISGIVDQTDERGAMRLLFMIGSGVAPESALTELFARTSLETRLRVEMLALDDGAARRVSFPILLRAYVRQLTNSLNAIEETGVTPERLLAEVEALRIAHNDTRRTQLCEL
jgi:DNA gyrase subunit A